MYCLIISLFFHQIGVLVVLARIQLYVDHSASSFGFSHVWPTMLLRSCTAMLVSSSFFFLSNQENIPPHASHAAFFFLRVTRCLAKAEPYGLRPQAQTKAHTQAL